MSARKMFKELGYKCNKMIKDDKIHLVVYTTEKLEISFDLDIEEMYTWGNDYVVQLTKKELQAITQQMKELGWLE